MGRPIALAAFLFLAAASSAADDAPRVEFEPKVGALGSRVALTSALPKGAELRFGGRPVAVLRETTGKASFVVPAGSVTAFLEVAIDGKVVAKSAVPFIVSGSSLVSTPKLIGLKEAIDVFGYAEDRPAGGEKPEPAARPVLKLDDSDILTIGEPPIPRLSPAVELGDAASAATRSMGQPGFLITARPPKKKITVPTPPPQ